MAGDAGATASLGVIWSDYGRIKDRELSLSDYEATLELPAVWVG